MEHVNFTHPQLYVVSPDHNPFDSRRNRKNVTGESETGESETKTTTKEKKEKKEKKENKKQKKK